jgi:hypothetical protein
MQKAAPSRPIADLTAADLAHHRLWVWASDEEADEGQDETWVHPVDLPAIPSGLDTWLVAASVTFANGSTLAGLASVDGPGTEGMFLQPVAVFVEGVYFPYGGREDRSFLSRELGCPAGALFPDSWRLDLALENGAAIPALVDFVFAGGSHAGKP